MAISASSQICNLVTYAPTGTHMLCWAAFRLCCNALPVHDVCVYGAKQAPSNNTFWISQWQLFGLAIGAHMGLVQWVVVFACVVGMGLNFVIIMEWFQLLNGSSLTHIILHHYIILHYTSHASVAPCEDHASLASG